MTADNRPEEMAVDRGIDTEARAEHEAAIDATDMTLQRPRPYAEGVARARVRTKQRDESRISDLRDPRTHDARLRN